MQHAPISWARYVQENRTTTTPPTRPRAVVGLTGDP